jgi:hypothetical protein
VTRGLRELPAGAGDGRGHWFDLPEDLRRAVLARSFVLVRRHRYRFLALRILLVLGVLAATAYGLFAAPLPVWSAPLLGLAAGLLLGQALRVGRLATGWSRHDDFLAVRAIYDGDGWNHRIVVRAMGEWADGLDDLCLEELDPVVACDRLLLAAGLYDRLERYLKDRAPAQDPAGALSVVLHLAPGFTGTLGSLCAVARAASAPIG